MYSTHGNTSGKNTGGGAPMLSQDDSAITRSGISEGTVSVSDAANQTQDIASLDRDTSNTDGAVAKLPDVNNLLDRQADMMAAASAAGEAVSRRIGDFAQSKYDEAKANGDQGGMDAWKEGGTARAEMQAAGAALVVGLAGGNALGGAAGAGIASIAAGRLNDLSDAIAGSNPTGSADINSALGNIVANVIATGGGGRSWVAMRGRSPVTTSIAITGNSTQLSRIGSRTMPPRMRNSKASLLTRR